MLEHTRLRIAWDGAKKMQLNAVPSQRRDIVKAMSKDPLYFMRVVAPWIFTKPFGAVHRAIMRDLPDTFESQRVWKAITEIIVPRGFAKSMTVTVGWVLWQAIFRGKKHIPISSVDVDTAEKFLNTIAFIVEGDAFKFYFGECVGSPWNKFERILQNDSLGIHCRIACYGVGQSVVGLNWLGNRPDLWVFDDIENETTVRSVKVVDERENWIFTVVLPALQGSTCPIIFIGTPYASDCVLTRIEKNKEMTRVVRYPILVETAGQSRKLGVPIGRSIWEENKPTEWIIAERDKWAASGKLQNWNLAFALKASCAKIRGFDLDNVLEFTPDEIRGKDLAYYVLCDFAYSKKASADPAAVACLGIDTSNKNKIYVIESDEGQWGDIGAIKKIADAISKYASIAKGDNKRLVVGIESYSYEMVKRLLYESLSMLDLRDVSMVQLHPAGRSKLSRIMALVPYCETGRFLTHREAGLLRGQMERFDGLSDKKLNLLDCCAYILDFLFKREPQKAPEEIRHEAWLDIVEMIEGSADGDYDSAVWQLTGCVEDECY